VTTQERSRACRDTDDVRLAPIWPQVGDDARAALGMRLQALEEVLCRLPAASFDSLNETRLRFAWGCVDRLGQVRPPANGNAHCVVHLSALLERAPREIVVTVIAHELAHVVLAHAVATDSQFQIEQELEAWKTLRNWGFAAEADVAEFLLRHGAISS